MTIGVFNPDTCVYSTIPCGSEEMPLAEYYAFNGACVLPDGRIAFIPWNTKNVWFVTLSDEKARARTRLRTEAVKEDLIAAAWHPKRMTAWCLDTDERRELAEMCG